MKRLVKNILLAALAGSLLAGPLQAQSQRDGYKFLEAVKKRQGDEATLLLEEPGSVLVNSRDISSGETALHIVTQRRDAVWLRFLLSKGANPNLADKHGTTPLQLAAQLGFSEGVEILAERGAARRNAEFYCARTDSALANARSLDDPLVARVERLRQVGVRDDLVWQGDSPAQYSRTHARVSSPISPHANRMAPSPFPA